MLWQGNPLWPRIAGWWPIGWVLETDTGLIVGSLGNIPLPYHFKGEPLIAASGRGWVVAPEYRGLALWLLDERFTQPGVDLFMDTTISHLALEAFTEFSNRIPAGNWEAIAYCVVGYRPFAKRALQKLNIPFAQALAPAAGMALRMREAASRRDLPKPSRAFEVESPAQFDSQFDGFWQELLRQNGDTLLADRDAATLTWHFSAAMRRGRLWIFTATKNRQLRAYCIVKQQSRGRELRRMRLVDYQTIERDVDLLPDLLRAVLQRCAAEEFCILDRPGLGLAKWRAFDEFAPYRGRQTWPLFYRAVDAALANELRQTKVWDPSEYDGDASIE